MKKTIKSDPKGNSRARTAANYKLMQMSKAAGITRATSSGQAMPKIDLRQADARSLPGSNVKVHRNEQRLAAIVASTMEAIIAIDEHQQIIFANPAAGRMFGYREGQLLGKPISVLIPARLRDAHDAHLRGFACAGATNRGMGRFGQILGLRADGSEFQIGASIAQATSGRERMFTVTLRDIHERVLAQKALQENYELIDRIFATTHFCIVYLDRDFNFARVNRAYADACGHRPGFFVGKNHFDLYPNEENEAIFRRAVATGEPFTIYAKPFEYPDHPELGVTYWDWTLHPLHDAEGAVEGLLCALLDVTARTRAAKELERKSALAQLLESLARVANEAATPAEALNACLIRLTEFGQWTLGHLVMIRQTGAEFNLPGESIWHAPDPVRYREFVGAWEQMHERRGSSRFLGAVLSQKKPEWICEIREARGFWRREAALGAGLRAAFAFPVLVQGTVVAFLEFFSESPRAVDSSLISASEIIAAQIARLIERSRGLQHQAQLALIVENSNDAILSCNQDGLILTWNAAAERLFGYAAAEAIGQSAFMLVPVEDQVEVRSRMAQLIDGMAVPDHEAVRIGKDGRRIEVAVTMSPIRALSGKPIGLSVVLRDIGERKRAESEHANLAAIVESSNDAILIRSREGIILSWNAAAERLLGWSAQEAVGQPIDLILPPERKARQRRHVEGATRGDSSGPVEAVHIRKGGVRIPTQVTFSPVRDSQGNVMAHSYTVRDISELKRKENALRSNSSRLRDLSRKLREAEESERRAIARELHDRIGQNLSTLSLIVGSVAAKISPESLRATEKHLDDMKGLLKSMVVEVRDLMAELRPPVLDDYGLLAALRQLAVEFTNRSGIAVELSGVDLQPRPPSIMETAIYRISQEALNNVAKHAHAKAVEIRLYASAPGQVTLEIADDGIGFDVDNLASAERHWGINTMRERAESVAIEFRLQSVPGAGTRVILNSESVRK